MNKWEYKTLKVETKGFKGGEVDERELEDALNRTGELGWELVAALDTNTSYGRSQDLVFLFKRPVP